MLGSNSIAGTMVGVKLGMAQSRLDVGGWGWSDWTSGVVVGGIVTRSLSDRLSLESGLTYARKGGTFADQGSHLDGSLAWVDEASCTVDYLEVPLLFRLDVGAIDHVRVVLMAGPTWRTALSSEWVFDGDDRGSWADDSAFGLSAGVGFEMPLGQFTGMAEVMYTQTAGSAGSVESDSDVGAIGDMSIQLGLGF